MAKKATYVGKLRNLWYLSDQVFQLDDNYKFILKCMIQKSDAEKGINEAEIVRFFERSEDDVKIKREAIHKRLFGSPTLFGLYNSEYVMIKKENKHRWGQQEKTFHLTVKGLFASISTKIPIEKIYLFKDYINFIDDIIDDKRIVSIIKQKIISDISIFLLWHKINGIQLQKLTLRHEYIEEFFNKPFLKDFIYFSSGLADEQMTNEVKKYFTEHFALENILSLFRQEGFIPSREDFLKFEGDDEVKFGKIVKQDAFKANFNLFIDQWPFFIESLHRVGGKKNYELFRDEYFERPLQYSFDINNSDVQPRIKKLLKNEGIKISFPRLDDLEFEISK